MPKTAALLFKDFLFNYFVEWEKLQPGRRSSFSAFARWLSENSTQTEIKQQLLSDWIKGRYEPSEEKYIVVLAEKLGDTVYDHLDVDRPNPYLQLIQKRFPNIPPDKQQRLAEDSEKYENKSHDGSKKIPGKRKTSPRK